MEDHLSKFGGFQSLLDDEKIEKTIDKIEKSVDKVKFNKAASKAALEEALDFDDFDIFKDTPFKSSKKDKILPEIKSDKSLEKYQLRPGSIQKGTGFLFDNVTRAYFKRLQLFLKQEY